MEARTSASSSTTKTVEAAEEVIHLPRWLRAVSRKNSPRMESCRQTTNGPHAIQRWIAYPASSVAQTPETQDHRESETRCSPQVRRNRCGQVKQVRPRECRAQCRST